MPCLAASASEKVKWEQKTSPLWFSPTYLPYELSLGHNKVTMLLGGGCDKQLFLQAPSWGWMHRGQK